MLRTGLLATALAAVVAASWARIEEPRPAAGELVLVGLLAIAPALLPGRLRYAAAALAALTAGGLALDVPARALVDDRDFVAMIASRTWQGFLDFYDVTVPFHAVAHPLMHGAMLMAVFGFSLAGALAVAARRPQLALAALLLGAGWPATIRPGGSELARGTVILVAGLALLVAVRPGSARARSQLAAGALITALAVLFSASGAVAKTQFVDWQSWDFYNKPDPPVGVEYVWRADYDGIEFPTKRTRVFRVRAPNRATYWRATTLDSFVDDHWDEDLTPTFPAGDGSRASFATDELALLPPAARDSDDWLRGDVTVEALRDPHLVAPSVPVAYELRNVPTPQYASGGVALLPRMTERGDEYTAWAYAPRPKPSELAKSEPDYPGIIRAGFYRSIERGLFPPLFGQPGRDEWMRNVFGFRPRLEAYRPLYEQALEIAGDARNPYAATVALEAWFRSGGGFTYDEQPPKALGMPPLVWFVTESKAGYCQHFAGAMALMLRYLGIPARVAAGFTSGIYNRERLEWTVNDRNAHTWVEVWFKGYGWLPFDPTPGQGNLSGPYSASSFSFDAPGAHAVLLGSGLAARELLKFQLDRQRDAQTGGFSPRDRRGDGGSRGESGRAVGPSQIVIAALLGCALTIAAGKEAARRRRYVTRDPRRLAGACRREIVEYLADQRIVVPRSATLEELRAILDRHTGVDPRRFVEALGAARYGPLAQAAAAARRARSELRVVRKRLRQGLSRAARLRGALSLRSLFTPS